MSTAPLIELNSTSPEAIDGRQIRAIAFHDVRLEYVKRTMGQVTPGTSALVVGGGQGVLPRGLARLGFDVTAVDPSETATAMARETAQREGLNIRHEVAPAEELPEAEATFDVVYVADTFEVTSNLDRVVQQAARVLKPGGVLLYDTVNRTPLSRLVYLGAFQGIPFTRIMPPGRYSAARLRKPDELAQIMDRHGLHHEDTTDFKPRNAPSLIKAVLARRRGQIADDEIAAMVDFVLNPGSRPMVTYLGHARKR